jgi:ATP-binding cassette subfamily B protein
MKPEELKKELLDITGSLLEDHTLNFRMQGHSMYPTLKDGDWGTVEKISPEELRTGDIVVFKSHDKLIAHRLIAITSLKGEKIFYAKGDKNSYKDAPFTRDALVGKIVSFQRKNKTIKMDSPAMKFRKFVSLHFSKQVIPFFNFKLRIANTLNTRGAGFKSIKQNISVIIRHSEKILLINAIISILQGIIPFVLIVCIKALIDQLTSLQVANENQRHIFIVLLVITALVFLTSGILTEIRTYFSEKLSQSITRRIYEKLHNKHASLDLSHYENPAEQDKIHRAVQEASFRPIKIANELLSGLKSIASALFLIGLFVIIKWYLIALLIIAIVPGVYFRLKFSQKLFNLKESQSTKEREMYYFNRVLTGFPFAKEMKLFGFFDFFKHRFYHDQENLFEQKIALRKSELKFNIGAQVFSVMLIFLTLGFISYLKLNGEITIGTVVLFFFAFQRGYSVLSELFRSITQLWEDNTFLNNFIDFLNMPTQASATAEYQANFSLQKEIKIENACFRYETSKRDVLKSVSITIPAGKTVAFVGANGSGKTTLIKLLCGFYQPDSGKILFDGVDASQIGQSTVCKNITAVFQDFALYNIPAIENLGLGNIHTPFDLGKAQKAAQAAGIADIIERLPDGYYTLLGNLFKGWEELSIGQWQKIAIARAFYRDSPLILMDEPSSALDAESELQIIESLKKLSHNKTAVIISHRLSTVQWTDLIYFFHEGEVVESGNHNDLMALQGKYYALFQTAKNGRQEKA